MKLSYVIVTRNRRRTLLRTLDILERDTGLPRCSWEVIVVDNASDDDTVAALRDRRDDVRVIQLDENEGIPARNRALPHVAGRYVAFLDDDSYPTPGAIPAALGYLARHPKTAALVARVVLPDGSCEAPAFPGVTMGGATVLRADVVRQLGGFAPEFFRQAEEYDLSFRLWRAGYKVERFEDVVFGHDKVPGGRSPALVHRMDLRNNLIVAERYLPADLRRIYRHEFVRRYAALAVHAGHGDVVKGTLHEARVWARRERAVGRRTLDPATVEKLFDLDAQTAAVARWARERRAKRVVVADWSKNVWATLQACRRAGLEVMAIVDNHPAYTYLTHRGLAVIPDEQAADLRVDGVVLSTVNPARVGPRAAELAAAIPGAPVLTLWEPKYLDVGRGRLPVRASA